MNQQARPPKQLVPDFFVFDIIEDLPAIKINTEEEVMPIEPNTVVCGVEASRK